MTRYRSNRPTPVGNVLCGFTKLAIPVKIREYRIFNAWADIVGEAIAKRSMPSHLIGKTLYVNVVSQVWLTELLYQRETLVAKINATLNDEALADIVLKLGTIKNIKRNNKKAKKVVEERKPLTDNQRAYIEKTVRDIKDPEIKDSIKKAMEKAL